MWLQIGCEAEDHGLFHQVFTGTGRAPVSPSSQARRLINLEADVTSQRRWDEEGTWWRGDTKPFGMKRAERLGFGSIRG